MIGGRRGDIDDERNALLLGDLGDRGGLAGIEGADQKLRAVADQLFGAGARGVDVRFGVGVHDRELGQAQRLQDRGRDVDAALAVLADAGLQARARQQHADLQRPRPGRARSPVRRARRRSRQRRRAHDGGWPACDVRVMAFSSGIFVRILARQPDPRQRRIRSETRSRHRRGNAQQPAVVAVARDQHQPDRQRGRKRQRDARRDRRNCRSRYCAAAPRCARRKTFGSATSAMVGATIASSASPAHRGRRAAHPWRATSRARCAACRRSRPPETAQPRSMRTRTFGSISCGAPLEPLAMDGASLRLHDAAIGVDRRPCRRTAASFRRVRRTPACSSRFSRRSERGRHDVVQILQRQALRQCRSAARRARPARAAQTPRRP